MYFGVSVFNCVVSLLFKLWCGGLININFGVFIWFCENLVELSVVKLRLLIFIICVECCVLVIVFGLILMFVIVVFGVV